MLQINVRIQTWNKTKHIEISITNAKGTNSLVINEAKILNCK